MNWNFLDTWIVITAALSAMACALPGAWLLLRQSSMMGDALAHTALPGVIAAFLFAWWLEANDWISAAQYDAILGGAIFVGAVLVGVATALITEFVQKWGRVERSASLGVVFTSLFALGLFLVHLTADSVHIDPDCVLFGLIETVVLDTIGTTDIPRVAVISAGVLALNVLLCVVFFKELKVSAFDPALATTLGINSTAVHYALMAVTALTVVSAFKTVGSILVVGLLIIPAATAHLLTDRLKWMLGLSLLFAGMSALLGQVMAKTLPAMIFGPLGFPEVRDAGTSGMITTAAGLMFVLALLFSPRHGLLSRLVGQLRLAVRIAAEDLMGFLYRLEERNAQSDESQLASLPEAAPRIVAKRLGLGPLMMKWTLHRLVARDLITPLGNAYRLTPTGRKSARKLVRAHRLWEIYMAKHFDLPDDHLHATAARVEHFLDPDLTAALADELDAPDVDPHGREIPE